MRIGEGMKINNLNNYKMQCQKELQELELYDCMFIFNRTKETVKLWVNQIKNRCKQTVIAPNSHWKLANEFDMDFQIRWTTNKITYIRKIKQIRKELDNAK